MPRLLRRTSPLGARPDAGARFHSRLLAALSTVIWSYSSLAAATPPEPVLLVPAADTTLRVRVRMPAVPLASGAGPWSLVELGTTATAASAGRVSVTLLEDALVEKQRFLVASIPPRVGATTPRRFRLEAARGDRDQAPRTSFRLAPVDGQTLALWEGERPVLAYNHGVLSKPGVPSDRSRSSYIHPLYGLDGEVLTDDFPTDHFHHRGLFWAWPHVKIEGTNYDLWMLQGIRHQFERWLAREAGAAAGALGVENGWYVGDRKVMSERAWITAYPATEDGRALDLDFTWIPIDRPVSLAGAEGKSYGGLTLRFAPRTNTVITTSQGNQAEDLYIARLPWADLSARFGGASQSSGAAVFIAPDHPGYPPTWLTRHYGVLCVGWPGVEPATFQPGEAIRCRYRIWVHRQTPDQASLQRAYATYQKAGEAAWETTSASWAKNSSQARAQPLRAELQQDRVRVSVGEQLFTEYLFLPDAKYPYFYPVNGPRTGRTVTVRNTEPYPHHSSLFFGCDRVNGGNYWQEGLERGRIVSRGVKVLQESGSQVIFEQDCVWERPGAESPFQDHRRITVSAPSPDRRCLDFEVTLTARGEVRIEKSNHSLFSARVAPELAVTAGGALINAHGARGEKGTFGQPAPWADYRGTRAGETEGLAIFCHPGDRWFPPPWFTRDYGFFSPTPMYWLENDRVEFKKGDVLRLRYRVVVHGDAPSAAELQAEFEAWGGR